MCSDAAPETHRHEIDVTALQRGHARSFAVEGHGGDRQLGDGADHRAHAVGQPAGAGRAHLHLARVGLHLGQQVLERGPGLVLVGNDHHDAAAKDVDGMELL
jgi:hypothetical protein